MIPADLLAGINISDRDNFYKRYSIRQGYKRRQIEEPMEPLKGIQQAILSELLAFPLHQGAIARPGMGIKDNAQRHFGARHLLKIDVKHCYQSVTREMCENAVRSYLPSPNSILSLLPYCFCWYQGKEVLPTGAPTSPMLCNIALTPIDCLVDNLVRPKGYIYTRYLDDLLISTTNSHREWSLLDQISKILLDFGLRPNKKKNRWQRQDTDSMLVTGVDIKVDQRVPRSMFRHIKSRLFNLAVNNQPLDQVTLGYLAHVKDINSTTSSILLEKYHTMKRNFHGAEQHTR